MKEHQLNSKAPHSTQHPRRPLSTPSPPLPFTAPVHIHNLARYGVSLRLLSSECITNQTTRTRQWTLGQHS
ncbi:hypothetical protein E2C01_038886 [Portunus trituberculatus]|uniref:Uncharacterized protein n=1 Tax=Portunus trituberculatus TaxID=210409 RepID=A0A5B7FIC7_PORTR|nr:hypothetical protein [Portunus trituberculatus]